MFLNSLVKMIIKTSDFYMIIWIIIKTSTLTNSLWAYGFKKKIKYRSYESGLQRKAEH